MRKVVSTMFMFLTVLFVWGQTGASFDSNKVKNALSSFQESKNIVIQQAANANISEQIESEPKLTHILDRLQFVVDNYVNIQDDEELRSEAIQITADFVEDYSKAIQVSSNDHSISIITPAFLNVVDRYTPQFDAFYIKAKEYIDTHPSASTNNDEGLEEQESLGVVNDGLEVKRNGAVSENLKNGSESSILLWITFAIGLLSLLLSLFALIKINKEHYRINKRKQELEDAERRINHKINEIKPSSYRGTKSPDVTPQLPQPEIPQQTKIRNPVTPVCQEDYTQRSKTEERPTISYLYATIKAQSPYAEFFKVSTENSGDKVFMLTLNNPEADVADFTIVPDMSPDFMKSVIIDRDTYLPSLFCEKSIVSSNPISIEVSSTGRAKFVDGKWRVQERMVIRLV